MTNKQLAISNKQLAMTKTSKQLAISNSQLFQSSDEYRQLAEIHRMA